VPTGLHPAARAAGAKAQAMGLVGYITKGVALGMVGDLLGFAALTFEQSKA
jgi:hypothetical protein